MLADDTRSRRGGEDAAAAHEHAPDAIGGGHPQDDLECLVIVVTAVAAQHQRSAPELRQAVENGLDEIFQIMRLSHGRDLLAQPRGAGPLVLKGLCADDANSHDFLSSAGFMRLETMSLFPHLNPVATPRATGAGNSCVLGASYLDYDMPNIDQYNQA